MKRRSFMLSGLAASAIASGTLATPPNNSRAWFELRFFHLRNDFERPRLDVLLKDVYLPASSRLGFGPVGFFNVSVGSNMPMLIALTSYASLGAMERALDQLAGDAAWNKAMEEFSRPKELVYTRMESRLLRAFASMPAIEIPPQEAGRAPRVFELRIYEARNLRASLTKIRMFEEEEIAIFRKTGLLPVFFGQTIVGTGLPSLTYMLAYDSMEAREENWRKFINHPDWIKLRAKTGYSDAEIVSNIHSCFLRPANYSPIR
ncbi:MAG: NIPSNAP family protein [Acidobacteria bacterium]|nr:NIPSNAP family protein [Acidobacteriota bacterium]MCI0628448.1 NIPSNAP family protein [Acidobacteriota bacterium]MCI0719754.1 NIPSNAP family protein [Acidobacteriota bacterium]